MSPNRQKAGIPAGGQFTQESRGEPGVSLTGFRTLGGFPVLGAPGAGYTNTSNEDGELIRQVRMENGKPNDAPDGSAVRCHDEKANRLALNLMNDILTNQKNIPGVPGLLREGSLRATRRRIWSIRGQCRTGGEYIRGNNRQVMTSSRQIQGRSAGRLSQEREGGSFDVPGPGKVDGDIQAIDKGGCPANDRKEGFEADLCQTAAHIEHGRRRTNVHPHQYLQFVFHGYHSISTSSPRARPARAPWAVEE